MLVNLSKNQLMGWKIPQILPQIHRLELVNTLERQNAKRRRSKNIVPWKSYADEINALSCYSKASDDRAFDLCVARAFLRVYFTVSSAANSAVLYGLQPRLGLWFHL